MPSAPPSLQPGRMPKRLGSFDQVLSAAASRPGPLPGAKVISNALSRHPFHRGEVRDTVEQLVPAGRLLGPTAAERSLELLAHDVVNDAFNGLFVSRHGVEDAPGRSSFVSCSSGRPFATSSSRQRRSDRSAAGRGSDQMEQLPHSDAYQSATGPQSLTTGRFSTCKHHQLIRVVLRITPRRSAPLQQVIDSS